MRWNTFLKVEESAQAKRRAIVDPIPESQPVKMAIFEFIDIQRGAFWLMLYLAFEWEFLANHFLPNADTFFTRLKGNFIICVEFVSFLLPTD